MNKKREKFELPNPEEAEKLAAKVLKEMEKNPGMTLKDATGVDDATLEEVYCLAYGYYDQGQYKESASLFQFLAGCNPAEYKYALGLASSYHQLELYQDAYLGFFIALNLEPQDPMPAYYAADCLLKLEKYVEADEFLGITIDLCGETPEYAEFKERCQLMRKSLKLKN